MSESGWLEMRDIISRIAVGPKGSKDITSQEASHAMHLCLSRQVSDIQLAVFLLALRLKRETDDECLGVFQALMNASTIETVDVDSLVSLSDPYNGFNRVPHFSPVTAATLASCGLPTIVHSAADIPPKRGVTARTTLQHWGFELDIGRQSDSVKAAATRAASVGVAYVDLADFCPALDKLTPIRLEISKRTVLATFDKLITPLRGQTTTHIVSGWVHSGYERLMTDVLKRSGFPSVLLLKGREGHCDAFGHRDTITYGHKESEAPIQSTISPKAAGINVTEKPNWPAVTEQTTCDAWHSAMTNVHSNASLSVQMTAATILNHSGLVQNISEGVTLARKALSSGQVLEVFQQF